MLKEPDPVETGTFTPIDEIKIDVAKIDKKMEDTDVDIINKGKSNIKDEDDKLEKSDSNEDDEEEKEDEEEGDDEKDEGEEGEDEEDEGEEDEAE